MIQPLTAKASLSSADKLLVVQILQKSGETVQRFDSQFLVDLLAHGFDLLLRSTGSEIFAISASICSR